MSVRIHRHDFGDDGLCKLCKVARKDVVPDTSKPETAVTVLKRIEHQLNSIEKAQADFIQIVGWWFCWVVALVLIVGVGFLVARIVFFSLHHE